MKSVTILCSDARHPINSRLMQWATSVCGRASVEIVRDVADLGRGDFLFLVSCVQIVPKAERDRFRYCLVLHASDLPRGRGMSPHVWQVLEGRDQLTVSLINAEDKIDTGDVWHQVVTHIPRTDLAHDINDRIFTAELELMDWALVHCDSSRPQPQHGDPTYYRRRTPEDSVIDITRPLAESFDLLRVADPDRYPAFFIFRGHKYRIRLEKF